MNKDNRTRQVLGVILTFIGLTVLCGCEPDELGLASLRAENAILDLSLHKETEGKDFGSLSLQDSLKLALKRNSSIWMAKQEQAIQREMKHAGLLRMLPQFKIDINYSNRDTYPASSSVGLTTGQSAQLTTYSYSSEQAYTSGGFGMLWNLMDFGVGYFRYKQDAKRAAIAGQDLRRARQNLVLDVTSAYWKCKTLGQVVVRARVLKGVIEENLSELEQQVEKGNVKSSAAHAQRYPLMKQLEKISQYEEVYAISRAELARIMGISQSATFVLTGGIEDQPLPPTVSTDEFSEIALLNRPELYQEDLSEKISYDEAKLTLLQILPTPTMALRRNQDGNKYLYYNTWTSFGLDLSANLLSIPTRIKESNSHQMRGEFIKRKRMALTLGILAQLHVALIEQEHALSRYEFAAELSMEIDALVKSQKAVMEKGGNVKEQSLIAKQSQQLDEYANLMQAYARLMTARARIYNTLGIDPDESGRIEYPLSPKVRLKSGTLTIAPKIEYTMQDIPDIVKANPGINFASMNESDGAMIIDDDETTGVEGGPVSRIEDTDESYVYAQQNSAVTSRSHIPVDGHFVDMLE